jgi:hypothetical protein
MKEVRNVFDISVAEDQFSSTFQIDIETLKVDVVKSKIKCKEAYLEEISQWQKRIAQRGKKDKKNKESRTESTPEVFQSSI